MYKRRLSEPFLSLLQGPTTQGHVYQSFLGMEPVPEKEKPLMFTSGFSGSSSLRAGLTRTPSWHLITLYFRPIEHLLP